MIALLMAASLAFSASAADLDETSAKFLDECRYIITKLEHKMFKSLETADERHQFINNFWKGLDPNPLTEVNEYRDLYYRRIDEANRLFTRGKAGYLTDRGKIYVLMGAPDEKETYYGGRKIDEKPSEIWIYRSANNRGLSRDTEITFIDETGTGNYRISSRQDLEAGAARASAFNSLRFDLIALQEAGKAQANPREGLSGDLATSMAQAQLEAEAAGEAANSGPDVELKVPVVSQFDAFKATQGKTLMLITVGVGPTEEAPEAYKVFARIQPADWDAEAAAAEAAAEGEGDGSEARWPLMFESFDSSDEADDWLLYQAQAPLSPGDYKVIFGVTDVAADQTRTFEREIGLPPYTVAELTLSSVLVATDIKKGTGSVSEGGEEHLTPFELSGRHIVIQADRKFSSKDELHVYYQVYGAANSPKGTPNLNIDYLILKKQDDGSFKPVGKMPNPGQTQKAHEYVLPLNLLPKGAGEYKIEVKVKDTVAGKQIKTEVPFEIR